MFKKFLSNKGIGYYIIAGIALLSLIVGIVFFATYKNPTLEAQMGNKAAGFVVETIGIFLIAGFFVELVLLLIPQYRFLQLAAMAMFGLAFYKDVLVIPDFIIGKINNVEYNGGNFGLNMFFFITILLIFIAAIVAPFLGFIKDEDENKEEMKVKKGDNLKLIKVGVGAVVVFAAVLTSSLVAGNMVLKKGSGKNQGSQETSLPSEEEVDPVDDLITDEIRNTADAFDYSFNPKEVLIKEQEAESYDYAAIASVPTDGSRKDCNIVYYFEGSYAEGYQGDYSPTYAYLYLYDDGVFAGKSRDTNIRGYWFNSSLANGSDESGADIKDCLNMVSNVTHYESIITDPKEGFYQYEAYIYLDMGWGTRSIIISGYEYYPDVALAIDTHGEVPHAQTNKGFDISFWTPTRVIKNLTYSSVFKPVDVTWSCTGGSVKVTYAKNKNGQEEKAQGIDTIVATFTESGEQTITASWGGFSASVTVVVD